MSTQILLSIPQQSENIIVPIYLGIDWNKIKDLCNNYHQTIYLVDEQVMAAHKSRFEDVPTIIVKSGESAKDISYVMQLMQQLIELKADRKSLLLGIGGGVVTDIVGFLGATYMRGVDFAFVPTTILAMVDAAIGGKNGINIGVYKNMMGTIVQPKFIAYDFSFLSSLKRDEWIDGFAEIIKHALIKDNDLYSILQQNTIETIRNNELLLTQIIAQNVTIKCAIVSNDVLEKGPRKLLNLGHTIAHAIEKNNHLSHGKAVSIGLYYDARMSETILGFSNADELKALLLQYELPVNSPVPLTTVLDLMSVDKKKDGATIDYILLNEIGNACIYNLTFLELEKLINTIK